MCVRCAKERTETANFSAPGVPAAVRGALGVLEDCFEPPAFSQRQEAARCAKPSRNSCVFEELRGRTGAIPSDTTFRPVMRDMCCYS